MSRKIFVGSLPQGVTPDTLKSTFCQYGQIEDVFVKQGCEAGRQWAFVTFADNAQAQLAKDSCDRVLTFPGQDRPCDVMVAKNQGMFGQGNAGGGAPVLAAGSGSAPETAKKVFVGSLPDNIQEASLREEFARYGMIQDIFIKTGCESGRQWAFVTYATTEEAQLAKVSTDRILQFQGASRACEVTLARNQGQFGQEPMGGAHSAGVQTAPGPKKVFIGSLPDNVTAEALRATFDQFGTIVDVFIKSPCDPGRQWAFVTYATPEQANSCKEQADRVLVMPGSDKPCEVMLARNQGKNGPEPAVAQVVVPLDYGLAQAQLAASAAMMPGLYGLAQPSAVMMPCGAPMQQSLWQTYQTATGLPYYHNHATGVTQWERPLELAMAMPTIGMPAMAVPAIQAMPAVHGMPAGYTMQTMQAMPAIQTVPAIQADPSLLQGVRYAPY